MENVLYGLIANVPTIVLLCYIWHKHEKRVENVEKRADEIEVNYLDRFAEVNDHLTDIKVDVAVLRDRSDKE